MGIKIPRKLSVQQVQEIRRRHLFGEGIISLGKEFGVSPSTILYHCNPKYREQGRIRAKRHYDLHPGKANEASKKYLASPEGKNCTAKSWVRNYLKNGHITPDELHIIIKEYYENK
jgi:hypothetical protein